MWNHDPEDSKWSLTTRPGWLRLTALPLNTQGGFSQYPRVRISFHEDHLLFAKNTAAQRICGSNGTIMLIDQRATDGKHVARSDHHLIRPHQSESQAIRVIACLPLLHSKSPRNRAR